MYDAIVVGARCGGAPTAMLLARSGYRVLLLDRSLFPSDIPHGHLLHRQGPRLLHQWGLLDRVAASNCPAIDQCTIDLGDFPLTGTNLRVEKVALGYGPRRKVLDQILVDAACAAGVEFRPGIAVEQYVAGGKGVSGVRCRNRKYDSVHKECGRIIVGADGRHSLLARTVGAIGYEETGTLTCWYFSYWSGVPLSGLEIYSRSGQVIFAFPTSDKLTAVFVAWPIQEFHKMRTNIPGHFREALAAAPDLAARVQNGFQEERFYGAADLPNYLRRPYGDGWALVGDAACHKDPYLALGISDAFRDAGLLSRAIDEGFSGRRPLAAAMAAYEEERNSDALPLYRENIRTAGLQPPPPEVLRLRAAIRDDPAQCTNFFLAQFGLIPREHFFNTENLQRLTAHGQ